MTYNENIKKSIMKWREKNIDKNRAYIRIKTREYREGNNAHTNMLELKRYYWRKEAKIFRNILIDL